MLLSDIWVLNIFISSISMEKGHLCYPILQYIDICEVPNNLGLDLALQIRDNLSAKRADLAMAYGSPIIENELGVSGKYMGCGLDFDNFRTYHDELDCEVLPYAIITPKSTPSLARVLSPRLTKIWKLSG